jgi:hypothetical protein
MAFSDPNLNEKLRNAWKMAPRKVRGVRLGNNKPLIRANFVKFSQEPCNNDQNWSNGATVAQQNAMDDDMYRMIDLPNT